MAVDHRHHAVVGLAQRSADDANEGGHEQGRVDAAGEDDLDLPGERLEACVQPAERPPVGDGVVHDDRVELRQLLSGGADDAYRPAADAVAHDLDRMRDRRQPAPVEQRLWLPHPARPAPREDDALPPSCQPESRAWTCWKPKRPLMQRLPRVTS